MEHSGKNKKVYLFLQVEGKLEEFKVLTEEDLGFSTITVQLLLMAKILDCALAPTNKAEKHRQEQKDGKEGAQGRSNIGERKGGRRDELQAERA